MASIWADAICGMRLEDLARAAGVSMAMMHYILCGERSPSIYSAPRIAAALGISVTELYRRNRLAQQMMAEAIDPLRRYPLPDEV